MRRGLNDSDENSGEAQVDWLRRAAHTERLMGNYSAAQTLRGT